MEKMSLQRGHGKDSFCFLISSDYVRLEEVHSYKGQEHNMENRDQSKKLDALIH